jgi:hypothetical protein
VKPGGDLVNTIVEIGIHAINPKGRGALKRIMTVMSDPARAKHVQVFKLKLK